MKKKVRFLFICIFRKYMFCVLLCGKQAHWGCYNLYFEALKRLFLKNVPKDTKLCNRQRPVAADNDTAKPNREKSYKIVPQTVHTVIAQSPYSLYKRTYGKANLSKQRPWWCAATVSCLSFPSRTSQTRCSCFSTLIAFLPSFHPSPQPPRRGKS